MELNLEDRRVLVAGSSQGIGLGIAESFLSEGARVVLTGRNPDKLARALADCRDRHGPDVVSAVAGDLSDGQERERIAVELARGGALDVLVANVGSGRSVPPLSENDAEFRRMLEINLLTAVGCVNSFLPLLRRGAAENGTAGIVFVSSICGDEALGCPVAYSAAKTALKSYALNIARPLGREGIRVNVVTPGNVIFPGSTWEEKMAADAAGVEAMLAREVPLGRLGTSAEIADVVVFLSSERAGFVSGANLVVDGGQTRNV